MITADTGLVLSHTMEWHRTHGRAAKLGTNVRRQRRAASIMLGLDKSETTMHSQDWFIATCVEWLASRLGDLHIETMPGDGWWVYDCRCEPMRNAGHAPTLSDALAKAVVYAATHTMPEPNKIKRRSKRYTAQPAVTG